MDFGDEEMGDIPTRPMRVKILYTFDQNNKDNCLARIQDVMNIPVVPIEEGNQVGVIELQQCIKAITSASPELVSRLSDGDFTIYAFDYSEPDMPLVGQGTLSSVLNTAQPTQHSQSLITGRVCKNVMALFKSGPKETLEVKLRLVPMSRPAQVDFSRSMDSLRSASPAMSSGFDPNAWNTSMQQSKMQQQTNDYFNFESGRSRDERDMKLVDDIFGFGSGSGGNGGGHQQAGGAGIPETPNDPTLAFNPAFSHSAPGSRAGSPMMVSDSSTHNPALRHQSFSGHPSNFEDTSRPGSRASVRSEVGPSRHQRQASTQSVQQQQPLQTETEVYYNEDGQPRKRAKVVQADWRGKSSFGSKSSDLRVNAATAASMHMHRPIPKRPTAPGSNLEPPPRVPTPVPQMNRSLPQQQPQQLNPRRSMLRQASTADSDFMSDIDNFSDAIMSSPEEDSPGNSVTAEGTPQEIPSSPPVFPGMNLPQPSSPGLPTLPPPRMADSGYMSERNMMSSNIAETMENDEDRSPDARDYEIASQYKARSGRQQSQPLVKIEGSEAARPMPPLFDENAHLGNRGVSVDNAMDFAAPQQNVNDGQGLTRVSSVPAKRPASTQATSPNFETSMQQQQGSRASTVAQTPFDQSQSRRGSLALPPNPTGLSSDLPNAPPQPASRKRQPIQRSRTTSNESEAGSPAPSDAEGGKPKGPKRSGTGASRRKVISDRLMKNIENGQPINYCFHCGAIETPTWRRLYIKECEGTPTGLDSHEGEGETIGVEVLKDKTTGEPLNRFVVRKSMKKTKDNPVGEDFEGKQVCNPCGLWFNKFRTMRPEEKWNRKAGTRNRKKKDGPDAGPATDGPEPYSEAPFFTDQVGPEDETLEDAEMPVDSQLEAPAINPLPPVGRPRANSMQLAQQRRGSGSSGGNWNAAQRRSTMAREVQSSPVRGFNGSQQEPIEIEDITPKPTRRLLFPSPRQAGQVKSLEDSRQDAVKSAVSAAGNDGEAQTAVVKTTVSLKPGIELAFDHASSDTNIFEAFTFNDKENLGPGTLNLTDDDLTHLFEGSPSMVFKTPRKTPSKNTTTPRSMKQLNHLLKTPTPGSRKRAPLTPNANAGNAGAALVHQPAATGPINDFMTSPSSSRYFLRSTPSRLDRTPGGRNALNPSSDDNNGVSPWSRHLAQMLSDNNDVGPGSGGLGELTSPSSRDFGAFEDLPSFTTPGRFGGLEGCDWEGLEGLLGGYDGSEGVEGAGEE